MGTQLHRQSADWQLWTAMAVLAVLVAGPIVVMARMVAPSEGALLARAFSLDVASGQAMPGNGIAPARNADMGDFPFGFVEFDWSPKPGRFDIEPPGSRRR